MKKILCLILSAVMIFSCVSVGMSASALVVKDWRPSEVSDITNPIILGKDTTFAVNINEIGYASVNNYAANGLSISEDSFDKFIADNADDKMLGVDFDFLYSKDKSTFIWSFLDYKLEPDLKDNEIIKSLLNGAGTVSEFKKWLSDNKITDFTVHHIEMFAANGKRSSCACKGRYDACAEILAGYDYDYAKNAELGLPSKAEDLSIFENIVESKVNVLNPITGKTEVHYNYVYKFSKSDFGLMRANSNNQIANIIKDLYGDLAELKVPDMIWGTNEPFGKIVNGQLVKITDSKIIATAYAYRLANIIGHLINPKFTDYKITIDANVFKDEKRVTTEKFFEKVTSLSGLDTVLDAKWCNAKHFNVKDIMSVLGVNVNDDVIFDVELTKGLNMGTRILTDMYYAFVADPVGYIIKLLYVFSQSYDYSYKTAINELFQNKLDSMVTKSRYDGKYKLLKKYSGSELETVDGLLGFIADCMYVRNIDNGNANAKKFTFAPLPLKRLSTAVDLNERYVYLLCYLELNRIYNGNAEFIDKFIDSSVETTKNLYEGIDKEVAPEALRIILNSMFKGELTFAGADGVYEFHLDTLTDSTIANFPDRFSNTIKKALAGFLQNIIDAFDNLMNILFGWTDGLFGSN